MVEHFKSPMAYEPFRPNRWILSFPDDFNLPEYCVNKVSKLKHYSEGKGSWRKLTITLYDIMGVTVTKNLLDNLNHAPIRVTLKKLDPTGVSVETIEIFSKTVDINFGEFDYASDGISKIKVILKPTKVQVS
jgi:hypothetical protein